jgi:tripartite-type tricarboxylate transporter receptor subunit TctC
MAHTVILIVVDNKPGASGNIAADTVSKATDGHTIGLIGNGTLTSSQFLFSRLPYEPAMDFTPLALVGAAPLVCVIAKGPTGSTAQRLVAQARAE